MPRRVVYQGKRFQLVTEEVLLPDSQTVVREAIISPGSVAILPLLPGGEVCLLKNQRYAVGETLWEIPAGTREPGEPPQSAAARELAEETGYQAGTWRKLAEFYPSPGVSSELMHLFVAQDLVPGPQQLEPYETIQTQIVPWEMALAWARDGTILDGKTLIALFLWDRLRGRV